MPRRGKKRSADPPTNEAELNRLFTFCLHKETNEERISRRERLRALDYGEDVQNEEDLLLKELFEAEDFIINFNKQTTKIQGNLYWKKPPSRAQEDIKRYLDVLKSSAILKRRKNELEEEKLKPNLMMRLPPELLVMVLSYLTSYWDVTEASKACARLNQAAQSVLESWSDVVVLRKGPNKNFRVIGDVKNCKKLIVFQCSANELRRKNYLIREILPIKRVDHLVFEDCDCNRENEYQLWSQGLVHVDAGLVSFVGCDLHWASCDRYTNCFGTRYERMELRMSRPGLRMQYFGLTPLENSLRNSQDGCELFDALRVFDFRSKAVSQAQFWGEEASGNILFLPHEIVIKHLGEEIHKRNVAEYKDFQGLSSSKLWGLRLAEIIWNEVMSCLRAKGQSSDVEIVYFRREKLKDKICLLIEVDEKRQPSA